MIVARPLGYGGYGAAAAAPVLRQHRVQSDEDRIRLIFGQVNKGIRDPQTRAESLRATRACRSRDDDCELAALFADTKRKVRYVADVAGIDTYQTPQRTRAWGGGDCDDHTADLIAHATAIGFSAGARIIQTKNDPAGVYSHVYAIVGVPKESPQRVVPLDTTVEHSYPGWEPQPPMRRAYRDFWYGETEKGAPVLESGDAGGGNNDWVGTVLIVIGFAAAIGAVLIVANKRRIPG